MGKFADNLVALRKQRGYSQKDFANTLGIPITTLSGYENCGREPKYELLVKMARLLDVSVDVLLQEDFKTKLNIPIRDEFLSKLDFDFIGDNLIIRLPNDKIQKEQLVLIMQLATKFFDFASRIAAENNN